MCETLRLGRAGKLEKVQTEAVVCTITPSHRLCVTDVNSGLYFLVDTGANVSVLPVQKRLFSDNVSLDYKLYAANGTEIKTYGTKTLVLNFKLRRPYRWTFIIADVKQPILGADFLEHYKLLVDMSERKLVDRTTSLCVIATIVTHSDPPIFTVDSEHPYFELLQKYSDVTKPVSFREPSKHSVYHHIETTGPPVYARARPLQPDRYAKVKEEFRVMQEMGICRPSKSPWASPLHIVPKKNGELRPCGDYRRLNDVTKPDRYPIPRLQEFTYLLANKKIYSKLDINRAYHFIEIAPEDIEKTAIITPFGLFEFPRMTFGLRNAAQTFQRFMNDTVLHGLDFIYCYIDDLIIASSCSILHKQHLAKVFERFTQYGISINLSKCCFGREKLEFLGYEVSTDGIRPLEDKVQAIKSFPKPQTVAELRRFLGMVNFYRAHLPNAASYQSILNEYLHGSKKNDKSIITWTETANNAFEQCKESLQSACMLFHPLPDVQLALMTDASDTSVGAVLQQFVCNTWKPLGYFSKALSAAQRKYSAYDRELLAIYLAIKHFRSLHEGRPMTIYTDHKPLVYAFKKIGTDKETPRRTRHLIFISEFTTDIRYITGSNNQCADALSRVETVLCPSTIDYAALAEAQSHDEYVTTCNISGNIQLKCISLPGCDKNVYCELSTCNVRPYVPESFRKDIFNQVHRLSHPGIRTTRKMVSEKFFWPGMNRDVGLWAKTCIQCQRSKVQRHTVSHLQEFPPCSRLEHVHLDIVGPLPITSDGYRYLVTMIDRCTRWPEAFPVKDITADTVAKVIYEGWIARFGVCHRISSDQGRQFESSLFSRLMHYMGVEKIRTTPYHPQSNGLVERWHRSLKVALTARLNCTSWLDELPTVLLGLRTAIRRDSGVSAAEMMYGQVLRIPGEFFDVTRQPIADPATLVEQIRDTINKYKPVARSIHSSSRAIFVHPDLQTSDYVFVRRDAVRKPLQPTYDGPYGVIRRGAKVFDIKIKDKISRISIDRLKPAYLLQAEDEGQTVTQRGTSCPVPLKNQGTDERFDASSSTVLQRGSSNPVPQSHGTAGTGTDATRTTRSGRIVRTPLRFENEILNINID